MLRRRCRIYHTSYAQKQQASRRLVTHSRTAYYAHRIGNICYTALSRIEHSRLHTCTPLLWRRQQQQQQQQCSWC
eukprot:jgi/Chrzof1/13613/Cz08g04060.t1